MRGIGSGRAARRGKGKGGEKERGEGGRDYLGPSSSAHPPSLAPAHRGALRARGGGPVPRSHATSLSP